MKSIKFKVYQKAGSQEPFRLYRVHPNGKVETSTNGSLWYVIPSLNAKIVNQWRRLGTVVKLSNREAMGPDREELIETLTRYRDCLMYGNWEHLSQMIPMAPDGKSAYERTGMQTVRICPTLARGYDGWSSESGLRNINKGLSIPVVEMVKRRRVLELLVSDLEQTVALM
ncbi:MAG: hypothetical protein ACRCXB_26585 [Aeromonadaceae bacterium]